MIRPALTFVFFAAMAAAASVSAKTSIPSLQANEMPCPASGSDASALGAPAGAPTAAPASPAGTEAATSNKLDSRAARQRWKALLPGTLKATS